jgi:serine/threonine protein phosphatase PrpC
LACDGLWDVLSVAEADTAVMSAINYVKDFANGLLKEKLITELKSNNEKLRIVHKAMKLYLSGNVKDGDKLILSFSGTSVTEDQIAVPQKE